MAAQIRAARGAEEAASEALDRLRLLTAQLDEAVTQVLALGLHPGGADDPGSMDAFARRVDDLVQQIEALQEGLRSVERDRRCRARRAAGQPACGRWGRPAAPASSPGPRGAARLHHQRRSMRPWE